MIEQLINTERMEHTLALFGNFDANIKIIQQEFNVTVILRGDEIKITGEPEDTMKAVDTINGLFVILNNGEALTEQNIRYVISMVRDGQQDQISHLTRDVVCITAKGRPLKAKTLGQKKYIDAIRNNIITFGVGPAGTGKTYLAVAMAVKAFRAKEINRIVLTRPAVEAGEKLGFLPGDLQNKVDPYLRPLYDALFDMLGADN
ncbi:MAG: PhoH family protein, partial [Oscillospiraceae bacterium]